MAMRSWRRLLAVLLPLETKTRYLVDGAALVQGRDAIRWAELLTTCRAVAERAAATAPDDATRQRFEALVNELTRQEDALRARTESQATAENPARKPAGP